MPRPGGGIAAFPVEASPVANAIDGTECLALKRGRASRGIGLQFGNPAAPTRSSRPFLSLARAVSAGPQADGVGRSAMSTPARSISGMVWRAARQRTHTAATASAMT